MATTVELNDRTVTRNGTVITLQFTLVISMGASSVVSKVMNFKADTLVAGWKNTTLTSIETAITSIINEITDKALYQAMHDALDALEVSLST